MASYKVAQDVEADDKLLGPFTFRQMIYLGIVAMAGGVAYGLWQLLPPLVVIPIPIIIFFSALALPLRKDQPMETYLAAIISYYLKPRKRMWVPDGIESLVQITAPHIKEESRIKDLGDTETERRLAYLATLVDTGGWAIRNVYDTSNTATPMNDDIYNEAQQVEDPLDSGSTVGQSFNRMIDQSDTNRREQVIQRMHQPVNPVIEQPPATPLQMAAAPQAIYPEPVASSPTMQTQQIIDPYATYTQASQTYTAPPVQDDSAVTPSAQATTNNTDTSVSDLSPDIMELANNRDLSIETMQHEAHRIHQKKQQLDEGEVLISLR